MSEQTKAELKSENDALRARIAELEGGPADALLAENAALRSELAALKDAPAPAPGEAVPLWRVAVRHSPIGAAARRNRTVQADSAEEAWPRFVAAVRADLKKGTGKAAQKALAEFEAWHAGLGGALPSECDIVPETEARAVLEACRLRAARAAAEVGGAQ